MGRPPAPPAWRSPIRRPGRPWLRGQREIAAWTSGSESTQRTPRASPSLHPPGLDVRLALAGTAATRLRATGPRQNPSARNPGPVFVVFGDLGQRAQGHLHVEHPVAALDAHADGLAYTGDAGQPAELVGV